MGNVCWSEHQGTKQKKKEQARLLIILRKQKDWRDPPGPGLVLSDGIHPGSSMAKFLLTRAIPACFYLAAKFNLPLYGVTALVGWKKLDVKR